MYETLNVPSKINPRHGVILFPIRNSFPPLCFLFSSFPPFSASAQLYRLFSCLSLASSPLTWLPFFVLLPSSPLSSLYQSVGCAFVRLFGIKSDSLRDWMCVAMACCIWKAIHSAGTLQFNLKQDWCWQTSHPLSSKMFPPLHTPIADGQRAYATL